MQTNENDSETLDPVWTLTFAAWLVATVATLGSLFFSEIMKYQPCVLCWYQRIAMYPLALILLVALMKFDKSVVRFSLPLAVSGALIALYHNLLNWKIIPESASPCQQGVSCTTEYIQWLGFITIPLLSLTAFLIIIILLLQLRKKVL